VNVPGVKMNFRGWDVGKRKIQKSRNIYRKTLQPWKWKLKEPLLSFAMNKSYKKTAARREK
jgi:hypothetical protein